MALTAHEANPAQEVPLAHGAAAKYRYDLPQQPAPTAHEANPTQVPLALFIC